MACRCRSSRVSLPCGCQQLTHYASHASVPTATGKPLVQESICSLPTFLQLHLQTRVTTEVSFHLHFRLCSFSWQLPRDAKIVMCAADVQHWWQPDASAHGFYHRCSAQGHQPKGTAVLQGWY